MSGACDAVSVIAAGDELAHGSPCCLLHGDSVGVRAGSQRFLLTVGEPQCHGHSGMESLRYHAADPAGEQRHRIMPADTESVFGLSAWLEVTAERLSNHIRWRRVILLGVKQQSVLEFWIEPN
jgi:hypothetical protein